MRRAAVALSLALCAVAIADPTPGAAPASHFSHADHIRHKVAIDKCESCHAIDGNGQVSPPAALGHAPCLDAGCHVSYFIGVSEAGKKSDPLVYAKATAFCLGCHDSKNGAPPVPWGKPTTRTALQSFQYEREYHVEMNHFEHVGRANHECRHCHVVDDKSFALVKSAPGHAQCITCHNAKKFPQFTMNSCGLCHDKPARADYFQGSRPKTDVRACDSEGQAAFAARGKRATACFRHERIEHRTANGGPVQCDACHYMIGDKRRWEGRRYLTLLDLHTGTIIDNSQDREHRSCGRSTACHQVDVDASRVGARCALCHAEKSAF